MGNIEVNKTAPDFEVEDFHGHTFKLSEFRGEKSVLLVLNRGFM
ncbi:redoxin domain-containing protein [Isachenkonia alkalipeptolytica]|nr:redoxin domain-containing protein [Isachenkonia alkalipeptolytica]